MSIFDIGRVCVKIAGRDAGNYCVVVDVIDSTFVEIDGQTRRRKCNTSHLEPLDLTVDVKKGADNKTVAAALTKAGFETQERKASSKKAGEKPTKQRKIVEKIADSLGSKAETEDKSKEPPKKTAEKPKTASKASKK